MEFLKYYDGFTFGWAWRRHIQNQLHFLPRAMASAKGQELEMTTETVRFWRSETCSREERGSVQVCTFYAWTGEEKIGRKV